ncbi:MAG TPA: lytic transglycosylase domain-containing protein [Rhizomicrobium sp.]|nr:lytic transglycosylase domain-containing protein [Rhizomicrobium sp.]
MAAWFMRDDKLHSTRSIGKVMARPQILVEMITATPHLQPSAFDEESAMTPSQLINRWDGIINEASRRFNVPKAWIRAVMVRESGGRTMLSANLPMISRAGAVGLMQVLPETYEEMAAEQKLGSNPFEPRDNIMAGAAYLRWLHHKYGFPAMFAAYNAGPGKLEDHLEHGASLPAETRAYVGGIAKSLKLVTGKNGLDMVSLTRPDGSPVKIDPAQVIAIRAALPGEYAPEVKTVITLGKHKQQAIREEVVAATAALRAAGKLI